MKNKWLVGGTALVLLAGAGVALWTGVLQGPDGKAAARSEATAPKGGKNDKKPDVPLEFLAREVVQPACAGWQQKFPPGWAPHRVGPRWRPATAGRA